MMNTLLILHLLITIALVGLVLIQRSEGGGTGLGGGGGGGGGGFMTTRGSANTLTRMTVVLAALFFASSILLSIVAGTLRGSTGSVLDSVTIEPTVSPIELPADPVDDGLPAVPTGD